VQVVKLKGLNSVTGWCHYFTIISRVVSSDGDDRVDSVILGIDVKQDRDTADSVSCENAATVGLVLPINSRMSVRISGKQYVYLVGCVIVMSPLRRHIFVCFMAKSAFWRVFRP